MSVPNRIEIPNAALPPGPGTLSIIEKEYTGGGQSITSTSPTQITGTQQIFALAGTQDVMFMGFASANPSVTLEANVGFGINIDGVDYYGTIIGTLNLGGNVQGGLFVSKGLSLGPGNHTVYLFAYRLSAARTPGSIISSASQPSRWEAIFGGGADSPNEPVVGGSGTQYLTIADAITGETETRVAGSVPQAGTGPGVLVGPGALSAVDDFYKDWFVVNTDTTPTNGLVSQWARVASYVGATRTMTLDKPWDFSAESDFLLVDPVRLTLKQDITEDVTVNKCAVMDLGGNRVKGKVDVTASELCWIRGADGYITNGIQKSDFGLLKVDKITVSRRDATIYALLMTSGSNLGRCEIQDCEFMGRVAGRRGYSGWDIRNCSNKGVPSGSNFQNIPYALVESIAGVAIVLSALDVQVDSELGGTLLYSENSITGGAAYISVTGDVRLENYPVTALEPSPHNFSIMRASGAGILTPTLATGQIDPSIHGVQQAVAFVGELPWVAILQVENFSGTATPVLTVGSRMTTSGGVGNFAFIEIQGTTAMSGTVGISGAGSFSVGFLESFNNVRAVHTTSSITGAVSLSNTIVIGGSTFIHFQAGVAQTAGAPTLAISSPVVANNLFNLQIFINSAAVSVGTWTVSGNLFANGTCVGPFVGLSSAVSGGTWTISGAIGVMTSSSSGGSNIYFSTAMTGGTVTISSAVISIAKPDLSALGSFTVDVVLHTGSGGTIALSGSLNLVGFGVNSTLRIVRATVSGATANVTGTVTLRYCSVNGAVTICNPNAAGTTVNGPATVNIDFCDFLSTFLTSSGGGTLTWAAAVLNIRNSHIGDLVTVLGTNFATIEAFHTRFNGNSANKSLTVTGTRPTTFRMWKCSWAARYDDLQPEVLNEYDILPAQAALVQGQPVKVNAANQYQVCVAASIVDGVALAAAGGAGTILIALRQGRTYVTCKAGTVNGDNLVLDLATPTQANQGAFLAGQEIGTALENVGAVVAGKCYTAVNVR
jgi:hypothetical protein